MTIEEIKELIKLVSDSGIAELELQRADNRVRIRRTLGAFEFTTTQPMPSPVSAPGHLAPSGVPAPAVPAPPASAPPATDTKAASAKPHHAEEGHDLVKSPIVGTYYDAPSPGAPPFVRVGDHVEPGQVLCIIESMKLMNEIESEMAGTIVAKLVENGRPVEYGEALFAVRPR
jgi:acetyl-CoA carboxylase biotin carboxyl carrier protein